MDFGHKMTARLIERKPTLTLEKKILLFLKRKWEEKKNSVGNHQILSQTYTKYPINILTAIMMKAPNNLTHANVCYKIFL